MKFAIAAAVLLLLVGVPASAAPSGNGLIAYVGPGGIYVISADGTGRRLFGRGYAPRWSPDGSKLAYLTNDELWVADASGTNSHRLAWSAGGYSWSPDGTRIVFRGAVGVDVVDVSSRRLTRLTSEGGSPPSWSPDGTQVVFGAVEGYIKPPIVITNADGSGSRILPVAGAVNPVWSPDGTRIAFVQWRNVDPSLGRGQLYTINPDGSARTRLSEELILPWIPVWSPDGARLLVTAARGVTFSPTTGTYHPDRVGTYLVAADGSEQRWLSPREGEFYPAWSPDGTKIVFTWRRDLTPEVFVANADGSCPVQIVERASADARDPVWQPVPGGAPSTPIACTDLDLRVSERRGAIVPLRSDYGLSLVIENISNEVTPAARVVIGAGNKLRALRSAWTYPVSDCPVAGQQVVCDVGSIAPGGRKEVHFHGEPVRPGRTGLDVSVVGRITRPDGTSGALRLVHTISHCTLIGGRRADLLEGAAGRDVICGKSGRDRILGHGGNDQLLGGPNADTIVGGGGRDLLSGETESDLLISADGVRDVVRCGSGRDRVLADRRDRVGLDCEWVRRR